MHMKNLISAVFAGAAALALLSGCATDDYYGGGYGGAYAGNFGYGGYGGYDSFYGYGGYGHPHYDYYAAPLTSLGLRPGPRHYHFGGSAQPHGHDRRRRQPAWPDARQPSLRW